MAEFGPYDAIHVGAAAPGQQGGGPQLGVCVCVLSGMEEERLEEEEGKGSFSPISEWLPLPFFVHWH